MAGANREIAKRLLQYRQHFEGEIKKADDLEAQAQAIRTRIGAQSERVAQGLPAPDACPDCWVQRGKAVTVLPHVSQGHDKFDRWACSSCGWHFDILAR
jgi:rubredoxin